MWSGLPPLSLLVVEDLRNKEIPTIGDASTKTTIKKHHQKLYHREKNKFIIEDIEWRKKVLENPSIFDVISLEILPNFNYN